jgi:septum formation protein
MLRNLGLDFRVILSPEEARALPGEAPDIYALRAARGKALAVSRGLPAENAAVLAADTVVALDGRILGKPAGHAEALVMLRALAGRAHVVFTACCLLLRREGQSLEESFTRGSRVRMWPVPDALLQAYAAGDEPLDKAGAYAIQGGGAFLVRSVQGSPSGVAGLPLSEVVACLLKHRVIAPI